MEWGWNLETIYTVGSILGFSFLYVLLKDIITYFYKPKLKILKFNKGLDLQEYKSAQPPVWRRKFANLHVKNVHRVTARRCIATLEFIEYPDNVTLHERQYTLHWADVPYSLRSTGAEPIDIGSEMQRLDVVFTDANTQISGCLISMPIALSIPANTPQAILPSGEYYVHIRISCDNGKTIKGNYKIISPQIINPNDWQNLDFEEAKGIRVFLKYLKAKLTRKM
ncbi:MAG: hypothetical protein PHU95_04320 [Candidatus Thermoplasmatota archaeon]|nr:hypothetical protein [Candidatus Thermoplasmatota archaeon]MDD5778653.1 hypothetical protein [Candidatus Thermoplasmatota archaeon]